ncbi:hypothetical protein H4Q26_002205 [Puccinia striiformis f. sp. tritici PST-130]|nr:hypothetical protein H4Q26_002205 [Puccinia striiformis f. sp. tritici PST-130]
MEKLSIKSPSFKGMGPEPELSSQICHIEFPRFPNLRQEAHWRKELPRFLLRQEHCLVILSMKLWIGLLGKSLQAYTICWTK